MFSKQFLRDPFTSARFYMAALATTLIVVALTACGGGGGGAPASTPPVGGGGTDTVVITPPVVVTYTAANLCASGPALTSTVSQAAANALVPGNCPALLASAYASTSVVVGSGKLTLSVNNLPAGFTGGVLMVSRNVPSTQSIWDIIPSTTGNGTAKFRDGSATPLYASVYQGVLEMNFVGAPSASKTITFTTDADPSIVVCTAPAMLTTANTCISPPAATGYTWNSVVKVWVADRGIYVTSINTLPATCLNIGDACYLAKAADGTIKFVQGPTSVMFAVYQTADGYLNTYPINAADGTRNNISAALIAGGASGNLWDYVVGTTSGIIQKVVTPSACFEYAFGTLWSNSPVTCPVGP